MADSEFVIESSDQNFMADVVEASKDINTVAGALGVRSIPAVYGFKNGEPIDAFVGAKPESEIKAFIEKLTAA